jgi:hypothetical protein
MLISYNHKFIFFKPLKSAGSSVEYSLLQSCGEHALCTGYTPGKTLRGYADINNKFMEDGEEKSRFNSHTWPGLFFERILDLNRWEHYRKITMVRNPWDTAVSWYWWSLRFADKSHPLKIDKRDSLLTAQEKFENFLNLSADLDSIRPETLTINCTLLDYISVNENFIDSSIDEYIRFESLQDDYDKICRKLSLEKRKLVHFKAGQRKLKQHYSYYYNDASRDAVAASFPLTIRKFKYTFL